MIEVEVRRDIDIGCGDQLQQIFLIQESVDPTYMRAYAKFFGKVLEAIPIKLAFMGQQMRMCGTGDYIFRVGMIGQNFWHRFDHGLDPLIRR